VRVAADASCLFVNARTKVSRYSAKGMTQSSGTAATSAVIYVVTPNIRLEGTNASASQRKRRHTESLSFGVSSVVVATVEVGFKTKAIAQMSVTKTANPIRHSLYC